MYYLISMEHSTKKLGFMFTLGGWIMGLLLLTLGFSNILDFQSNPNRSVSSAQTGNGTEIILKRNRQGHYVFNGLVNQKTASFLVDTGATMTSVPGDLAVKLNLKRGYQYEISTANGNSIAYATTIDQLNLGGIELFDVPASLVPGFKGNSILLGMNVLKHMELIQRGDQLTIRQTH
ncbi:MAG: aspartyl protease family protein [Gammaproteobacteria bacterium]